MIEELDNVKIRMTELTAKIASNIILPDTSHLHNRECENYNKYKKDPRKQMTPYLSAKTTSEAVERIQSYSFNQVIIPCEGISVKFIPNGHLSGSASILFEIIDKDYEKQTVLFSGDTSGTKDIPFTKPLDIKGMKINHIISEGTYNDKLIPKNDGEERLEQYIRETCLNKRGKICSPVFSVGRSTNIVYQLRKVFKKNPEFNNIKIYLCSPMLCKAHRLILSEENLEFYDEKWHKEIDLINWEQVEYIEDFKSLQYVVNLKEPCIYLASSGMVKAYSEYIIGKLITGKNNRVVFAGYQADGTNGRVLIDGIQKYMTVEDEDNKKKSVPIKASISEVKGQSGHSDYKELCDLWSSVEKKKLKTVLLNHGNPEGMPFLKGELEKVLPNVKVLIPKYNESIRLI